MANYQSLSSVIQRIGSSLTNVGCNSYFYGVPSQLNDQHSRTYPCASVYVNNTSVVVPNNYQRGQVEVNTDFEIYIWSNFAQKGADVEPNLGLQILHSNAQDIATDFLRDFFHAIEDDNFDMVITNNSAINLTMFEEHGTDRIAGCRFSLGVSYYETCAT